jgi:tryptophan synthase beta chain
MMVRDFQAVIGNETENQLQDMEGRGPDYLLACVGGGSNSLGLFYRFLENESVKMIGVEAGGLGIETGKHAAPLCHGSIGVLHGSKSYLLQDENGQIKIAHSVSAGLDYPGVGPEHSLLKDSGRVSYKVITDQEAMEAFQLCSELEGIIPALETAHALAYLKKLASSLDRDKIIVVCFSGRGDKDVQHAVHILEGGNG